MNDLAPLIIPLFGGLWAFMILMLWGVPAIRNFKSQRKMLEEQADQLHKLNMQIPHLIDFVHEIRHRVEDLAENLHRQVAKVSHEVAADRAASEFRSEVIQRAMPGSARMGDQITEMKGEFDARIATVEKKLDELSNPAPVLEEEVVEEAADPSAPVPFEVYREALLKLWDGEVSIEEHCNEWRGRLVLPRPGRKARA